MGKLALLFVMVAVLGGSLLTFRTRMNANETDNERRDVQGDLLARDAATSGHGLVLNAMLGTDGFNSSLGFDDRDVRDGRFTVDNYSVVGDTAFVEVTGHSGGATHTIRSKYEWDPMDFPGPIWLDVPYATADIDPGAGIDGGPDALPVHYDDRRYNELGLGSLLPWDTMEDNLTSEFAGASGPGGDFQASDMLGSGYLEDLNTADASDLYYAALGAMGVTDVTVPGPVTITSTTQNFGSTPKIVRITGSLELGSNGHLIGAGILVVEGPIEMSWSSASLTWDGIVLVHSDENYLPINLSEGTVDINGTLVVDHQAMPPGGHMDLTVMREDDGSWSSPEGTTGVVAPWTSAFPWYQHKHRFDIDVPEERTVYFAEEGVDRHEQWTQFRSALAAQGSSNVSIKFKNRLNNGYASYTLDIAGQPQVYYGTVANGFGAFARSGDVNRTQSFRASDLRTFIVDVHSLRMLKQRWDGVGGCAQWPFCVGRDYSRESSLYVRLYDSSGHKIYVGALYWHMRVDEVAEHNAQEDSLRAAIEGGAEFGTNLTLGPGVDIGFDMDAIEAIGTRLGFDGDEVINRGSWTEHTTAREYRAQGVGAGVGGGPGRGALPPSPPPPMVTLCHTSGGPNETLVLPEPEAVPHLLHGDPLGAC